MLSTIHSHRGIYISQIIISLLSQIIYAVGREAPPMIGL